MKNAITTCDVHRQEKRRFLKRDDHFNYLNSDFIDKESCFETFHIEDSEEELEKELSEELKRKIPDMEVSKNYDLRILNEIFQEEGNRKHIKKKNQKNGVLHIDSPLDPKNRASKNEDSKKYEDLLFFVNMHKDEFRIPLKRGMIRPVNLKKKNSDLVELTILKNILNIYFLFDLNNDGYIDLKVASEVIENIYENKMDFLLKHIKLNDAIRNVEKCAFLSSKKAVYKNICTESLATCLLLILRDVSVFHKKEGVLLKKDFIDIMYEFIKSMNCSSDQLYRKLSYPNNFINAFYNYLYVLKMENEEKEQRKQKELKKKTELKNTYCIDSELINSGLRSHIRYFKKKKEEKLQKIRKEKESKEMEQCTFNPSVSKKPLYLWKQKMEEVEKLSAHLEEIEVKKNFNLLYDIDNTIERTPMLPSDIVMRNYDQEYDSLGNVDKPVHLKYIIHQGHTKPQSIQWNDTLRNQKMYSMQELLEHANEGNRKKDNIKETEIDYVNNNKIIRSKSQQKRKTISDKINNGQKEERDFIIQDKLIRDHFHKRISFTNKHDVLDPLILDLQNI